MKKLIIALLLTVFIAGCVNGDVDIDISGDPFKGGENANVTIVEFSDFQCSACRSTYPIIKQLAEDYGDQIKIVYKDMPLVSSHQYALGAAEAAQCAFDQGKFWEYHDVLFTAPSLDKESLKQYAADLSLNVEEFNSCLDSGKTREGIQRDVNIAAAVGVDATPYFFINGEKVRGGRPLSEFKKIIDKYLE